MILTGETFSPYDFDELSNPVSKEQSASMPLSEIEAVELLQSLGYTISK